MLELNRQFSQVRTLWKDIQINKVQSDIVKLLQVSSRRSSAGSAGSSDSASRAISPALINRHCHNDSRYSSGLPSSVTSSPGDGPMKRRGSSDLKLRRCFTSSDISQLSPVSESELGFKWMSDPEIHCISQPTLL